MPAHEAVVSCRRLWHVDSTTLTFRDEPGRDPAEEVDWVLRGEFF